MKLSKTAKNMILVILVSSAVFIAVAALVLSYYRFNLMAFAIGVMIGSALNIMKVVMLENTVERAVRLESKEAGAYLRAQALLRFILTGVVLAAAAILPFVNLWGAAAGIFTLQIAAYAMKFFIHDEEKAPSEKTGSAAQEKEAPEPADEENSGAYVGEKNNDVEEIVTAADEDENLEESGEPADEEKQRIRKKPSGQRADKRMKKKPARRYR